MSGGGAPRLSIEGAATLRVAVIASQWHERLMDALLDGARRGLRDAGVETDPVVVRVPGAFELPVAVANLAQSGHFHALVALGLVPAGLGRLSESATTAMSQLPALVAAIASSGVG